MKRRRVEAAHQPDLFGWFHLRHHRHVRAENRVRCVTVGHRGSVIDGTAMETRRRETAWITMIFRQFNSCNAAAEHLFPMELARCEPTPARAKLLKMVKHPTQGKRPRLIGRNVPLCGRQPGACCAFEATSAGLAPLVHRPREHQQMSIRIGHLRMSVKWKEDLRQ